MQAPCELASLWKGIHGDLEIWKQLALQSLCERTLAGKPPALHVLLAQKKKERKKEREKERKKGQAKAAAETSSTEAAQGQEEGLKSKVPSLTAAEVRVRRA
jgi:hypothetical protein